MNWNYHSRSRPDTARLEHTINQLRIELIKLRRDLTNKAGYATRLEILLRSRTERCDELANTIAALREQNQRLDAEAEHYFRMLAAG